LLSRGHERRGVGRRERDKGAARHLVTALLFVAGFSTVFVGLGATASAFGALLRQWSHALSIAAGIGIILMGLHFLGVFRIGAMLREKRLEIEKPPGVWSAYLMGLAFAFGWTPCIGPILAAILAVAEQAEDTVAAARRCWPPTASGSACRSSSRRRDRSVHARFAPLCADSSAGSRKPSARFWSRPASLFLTGGFQNLSFWLIETFPQFGQIG
jgi:cytochrome c-type biogenesis protein